MASLKALVAGVTYIFVFGQVILLAYIFLATGYAQLSMAYPGIAGIVGWLSYVLGILVYFLLMASGGYVTAMIAKRKIILHCVLVGALTTCLSLFSSNSLEEDLTALGGVFVVSGILFVVFGGVFRERDAVSTRRKQD